LRLSLHSVSDQKAALGKLAKLTEDSVLRVRPFALRIVKDCRSRDDEAELTAIYNAVKHGHPDIPGMEKGFKYVADPRMADYFVAPFRALQQCATGACAEDCDGHAALNAALGASIGYRVGLRAWGPANSDEFVHVYAVAALPKRNPEFVRGMDTTVPEAKFGWEPPRGNILTAWLE
jgi:hypothetical protein